MQKAGTIELSKLQRILCTDGADAQGLDSQTQIFRRTGRRGHIEDIIDVSRVEAYAEKFADIPFLKTEARLRVKMGEIAKVAGGKIVNADDGVAFAQQAVRQVGTEKSGRAGNQHSHCQ